MDCLIINLLPEKSIINVNGMANLQDAFGIDWDGPVSLEEDNIEQVRVPDGVTCLSEEQETELSHAVNPLIKSVMT